MILTINDVMFNRVKFHPERLWQVISIMQISLDEICYHLNLNVKYMTEILEGRQTDIDIQTIFKIANYLNVKWQFFYTPKPNYHIYNITAKKY